MAGFVSLRSREEPIEFHVGTFPTTIEVDDVDVIQLDCDELEHGLRVWPEAATFVEPEHNGRRVKAWRGASARRMACKILSDQGVPDLMGNLIDVKLDPRFINLVLEQQEEMTALSSRQAQDRIRLAIKIKKEARRR